MSDLLYNPANLSVLIVDDHDPIRKGIKRVLGNMGFGDIIESFDGDDAIKVLNKKPIDILIVDLYMRNVSGFDVLHFVRNRDMGSDIPVIVVTGEASKEEIVKAVDMGAEDYLLKPFQAADLEKKITKTLNMFYSPTPLLKALRRAERLYLAGDHRAAAASFDAALAIDAESARAVHGKAKALAAMKKHDEAVALLEASILKNHSFYKNHGALADILLSQGKLPEAVAAMRRELEINPKQLERQIQLAKLLLKEGDPIGAIEHYRIALQENPKRLTALMGMGQAYSMADNLEKAVYYFKRARRYHPTATKALEAAIRCCVSANDYKRAEILLKDERAAHPERTDASILLSMLYMRQDRDDDALAVADELLAKNSDNAAALRIKANVYIKRGDHTNALAALQAVNRIAPSAETLVALGETLLALRKIPEAMNALNKAVALHGDNPQAYFLLAEAHRQSQQWIKACYLYLRAARKGASPERCEALFQDCIQRVRARRNRPRAAS